MGDDEDRVSLDWRCNSPLSVTLSDSECIERVANTAVTASDDFDLAVQRIVCGDHAHHMHSEDWFQNIRAFRDQDLDFADVLPCDSAKLNFGRPLRGSAAAKHESNYKTREKLGCGLHWA